MAKPPRGTSMSGRKTRRLETSGIVDPETGVVKTRASSGMSRILDKEGASASKECMEITSGSKTTTDVSGTPTEKARKFSDKLSDSVAVKPVRDNSGFFRVVIAGVAGGLITLAGLLAMQYAGFSFSPFTMGEKQVLTSRVSSLESQLVSLHSEPGRFKNSFASTRDLTLMKEHLLLLENGIKEAAGSSTGFQTATFARLQELTSALASLKASTSGLTVLLEGSEGGSLIGDVRQASARFLSLERNLSDLKMEMKGMTDKRINGLEEQLKRLVAREKLSRSVAFSSLKASIDRGEEFSGVLDSLEILTGPSKELNLLKPYAQTGAPSAKVLLEEFRGLRRKMVLASTGSPELGIGERLLFSVRSLVTISSSKVLPGNSPEAILSRIDANLKAGKPELALSEWETLPEEARKVSGLWAEQLMLRVKIERNISSLMQTVQSSDQNHDRRP